MRKALIAPSVVSFEEAPELCIVEDPDIGVDPEAQLFAGDHSGVAAALDLLPPRQRQIFCEKIGLNESGLPRPSAEIANELELSVETISSSLTRSRNRLRSYPHIIEIINGENVPMEDCNDNPLQTS